MTRTSVPSLRSILPRKAEFAETGKPPEEVGELYPLFSPGFLFDSVREWIRYGDWDKRQFMEELSRISTVDLEELMKEDEEEKEEEKEGEPA